MRFTHLAMRNMKEIYRDYVSVALGVAMPMVLLAVFVSINQKLPLEQFEVDNFAPGMIVFGYIFFMMYSATLLAKDRKKAFLTRLYTTPLTSSDFILAYSLPFIPLALVQTLILYAVALGFGLDFSPQLLLSLVVLIPTAYVLIGIGMVIGSSFSENQVSGVGSLLFIAFSFLGGAWMDVRLIGGWLEQIAYLLPFIHAIEASKAILDGANFAVWRADFVWVVGYGLGFNALGAYLFHRARKLK